MSNESSDRWEQRLTQTAATFSYPPTPNVAEGVRQRLAHRSVSRARVQRLAWVVAVVLLLATVLLSVPGVRAAVLKFFQIGAVRILPIGTTDAPALTPLPAEVTPLDLAGATTWQGAQAEADFSLRLPAYPATLGLPDEVFLQEPRDPGLGDQVVITVWRDEEGPDEVVLALYQIAQSTYGLKAAAQATMMETEVHGELAFWVGGPHWLQLADGELQEWLFVEGNVLIWVEDGITYRLEGAASVDEAVRIAASLR